ASRAARRASARPGPAAGSAIRSILGSAEAEAPEPVDEREHAVRAAGRRGAGAPPAEARVLTGRAAGRRGAGAPPAEARVLTGRAAGRRGAGAPPAEARR